MKFYIHAVGGLGDHFHEYFGGHWRHLDFSYLKAIKIKHPDCYVKVISHSACKEAVREYFKFEPDIDELHVMDWVDPNKKVFKKEKEEAGPGFIKLSDYAIENNIEKVIPDKVYMRPEEEEFVEFIRREGEFITVHPFAGEPGRIVFKEEEYINLISRLRKKLGVNIVVLGASNIKREKIKGKEIKNEEKINISSDGIFNLVNKINIRVACGLIMKSSCLVANHSSLACFLTQGHRPLVIMLPKHSWMTKHNRVNKNFLTEDNISLIPVIKKKEAMHQIVDTTKEIIERNRNV